MVQTMPACSSSQRQVDPCEFKSSLVYIVSLGHQSYLVRYNTADRDENMSGGRDRKQRDVSLPCGCMGEGNFRIKIGSDF